MLKTLSRKIILKNKWFKVYHDKFLNRNGAVGDYYIFDSLYTSLIIPVRKGNIILEKQFRYPLKKWVIELPAGCVEKNSNFLKTAAKELEEETGYRAKKIILAGSFFPSPGNSPKVCQVFIAKDLEFIKKNEEETEIIKLFEVPIKEVYQMAEKGKIKDGYTLAALAIAKNKLLNK